MIIAFTSRSSGGRSARDIWMPNQYGSTAYRIDRHWDLIDLSPLYEQIDILSMGTIEQNKFTWDSTYDWEQQGDEWSSAWGGVDRQWYATILPRMHAFVPTGTILEIAPGFGRWTKYLKDLCEDLILVDLSEQCIQTCQKRFDTCSHIKYFVNDGKSLEMIPDDSIDFVFSFDSLVHAEDDVIKAYTEQLAKKLKDDGVGFIHHSNIGEYLTYFSFLDRILGFFENFRSKASNEALSNQPIAPEKNTPDTLPIPHQGFLSRGKDFLYRSGLFERNHWRAYSMTAGKFKAYAEEADLQCITQEKINWGKTKRLIDCITIFTKKNSIWASPHRVLRNKEFMREAKYSSRLSKLYGSVSLKKTP